MYNNVCVTHGKILNSYYKFEMDGTVENCKTYDDSSVC